MAIQYHFKRWVSTLMMSLFTLSLFAFAPVALAAPMIDFASEPAAEFLVYEGGTYDLTLDLSGYMEDTTVKFYVKGPLGEPGETEELIETYEYITNVQHTFSWDGKFGVNYPSPGTYELRLQGTDLFANNTNVLTHQFEVTEETHIDVTSAPTVWFSGGGTDYVIAFDLLTAVSACIDLRVDGVNDGVHAGPLTNGSHTISWDGTISASPATNGPHDWLLYADDVLCGGAPASAADLAAGTVVVTDQPLIAPVISALGMTIDPFSPDGDGQQDTTTVTFNLNTDADVTVSVENSSNVQVKVLKNAEATSAGTVNVVWDGKETGGSVVSDGTYIVKVMVTNASGSDSKETTVDVDTGAQPQPGTQCGGYSDVPASHPDCDAIEFVQSIGAMTGHPDGTFRPDEILQRDQVAKISLETFNLFNASVDYCGGAAAFPDVPSSQWSYQYICRGVELGMITGYQGGADAGYYRPARSVNRVEFLALILRNLSESMPSINSTSYADVEAGQWFSGYAKYSYDHSLFVGTNLMPTQFVTRLEVAQTLYKLDQQGKL